MTGDSPFRVAIVGGGISGVVLAIALLRRGINVDVYEQASKYGEIGAGVAFTPNAVQAMKICSPDIDEACRKICTGNTWMDKKKVWFDWVDGYTPHKDEYGQDSEKWVFRIENSQGANSVHRAAFLDEAVKLVPEHVSHFGKHLVDISEESDGTLKMSFGDGTSAHADAVIGCDGIKSRVRRFLFGDDHPSALPGYTYKYAYRGLVPVETAIEHLGEEKATNAFMHLGQDGHVLTFPVAHGKLMNVVAFKTNTEPWPDNSKFTMPSHKSSVLRDFADFSPAVKSILGLLNETLDCWAIFDTADNPVPYFSKGRVCLLGDAAHASSPHHGAGAGFCVEDAAVMADLLALVLEEGGDYHKNLKSAFVTFDAMRRERTQWLVQSSRFLGDLYEWRAKGVGNDIQAIENELRKRVSIVWDIDMNEMVEQAKDHYRNIK